MATSTAPLWKHGSNITFAAPNRKMNTVFLHCSASDNAAHDDVSVIRQWHLARGWSEIGYHYFVNKTGDVQAGRALERTPAAQKGHNTGSIAISLHGLRADRFTPKQFESLVALCKAIDDAYDAQIRFRGHCEVSTKSCPVFNYRQVLGLDASGYRKKQTVAAPPPAHNPTLGERLWKQALELLDFGRGVRKLQNALILNGAPIFADGLFGQATDDALRKFQRSSGLRQDGVAGPKSLTALAEGKMSRTLRTGDRGTDVRALQELLNLNGANLSADGAFGHKTRLAVISFQTRKGLSADGIVGPKTRKALLRR